MKEMDGSFDKEFEGVGNRLSKMESEGQAKNKMNWNTVLEQWEDVLNDLIGNERLVKREEMKNAYVRLWRELKSQELVPCNNERRPLLPYLNKAAENAKVNLEQHEQVKPSLLFRGNWKKKREVLELRRKYLYNMSVTCAALELSQRKVESRKLRTAMLHAAPLSSTPPPPYNNQMPQFKITSGTVTAEEVHSGQEDRRADRDRRLRSLVNESEDLVDGSFQELRRVKVPSMSGFETVDEIEGSEMEAEDSFASETTWGREMEHREQNRTAQFNRKDGVAPSQDWIAQRQPMQATLSGTLTLHSTPTHGLETATRGPSKTVGHQYPLLRKAGQMGGEEYKPFSFADMNTILDQMPRPAEVGGGPWMSKLTKVTMGHKLAVGDWRAMLCNQTSTWEMDEVESGARTRHLPDSTSLALYATEIGSAMRKRYPVPPGAMHTLVFSFKEGQDIHEFLTKSKETWTDIAGSHPGSGQLHTTLFRQAVLAAVPRTVREAIESNPDLPGCTTEQWERHLKHHIKRYTDKRREEQQGTETAQTQLLKLQLAEAKKRLKEEMKDMV